MNTPQNAETVLLMGVGDVGPAIDPVDTYIELALPTLQTADLRFAQCERLYSERGSWQVQCYGTPSPRIHPSKASIFKTGGFDVVSLAANKALDFGYDALFDTMDVVQSTGARICGVGRDIEEARRPVIVECKGVKIAFLAYCSVLREGYAAGPSKPGVAPMEAHTYYAPQEYQAGTPPKIITIPYEDQLEDLKQDIAKVRSQADVVVMSIHWGVHHVPKVIAMYQTTVAHAAIDAGVDLILGHHAHTVKAIEVYKGKVCFYSLGNFMMAKAANSSPESSSRSKHYGVEADPELAKQGFGYSRESRNIIVAQARFSRRGVEQVSFLPAFLNAKQQPEILKHGDERFNQVVEHVKWASDEFPHRFRVEGDEVVVETP